VIQLQALLAAAVVVIVAAGLLGLVTRQARGRALGLQAGPAGRAHILYFSGEGCTVCRTHQEPALGRLDGVPVRKVDALAERDLAQRFRVFTLPTTVVVDASGRARHVNYGYAPLSKLEAQLANL